MSVDWCGDKAWSWYRVALIGASVALIVPVFVFVAVFNPTALKGGEYSGYDSRRRERRPKKVLRRAAESPYRAAHEQTARRSSAQS